MRTSHARFGLALLTQLVLLTGIAAFAQAGDLPSTMSDARRLLGQNGLMAGSRNVTRVAVHAPGQYASEVLSVFKMRIGRFVPVSFGFDRELLRPYLLGGRTSLRLPSGRTVGEAVPGGARAAAVHIGGGAELRLHDGLFVSMDVGEVMQSGMPLARSYTTWRLGLLLDF